MRYDTSQSNKTCDIALKARSGEDVRAFLLVSGGEIHEALVKLMLYEEGMRIGRQGSRRGKPTVGPAGLVCPHPVSAGNFLRAPGRSWSGGWVAARSQGEPVGLVATAVCGDSRRRRPVVNP